MTLLIGLQALQVAILWLHDWLPLGRLTDPAAALAADGRRRLIGTTLVQSVPYTFGLVATIHWTLTGHPSWIWPWLWISYTLLFAGELRAWWWPYLICAEPARATRYDALFGRTAAFLPKRNGIKPNTLHCVLHGATLATLALVLLTAHHRM